MKRLLPLVVLLVLVLVGGVWWISRESSTNTQEGVRAQQSAAHAPTTDGASESARLSGPALVEEPAATTSTPPTPPRDERVSVEEVERRSAAERANVVRGRVTIPAGCALADDDAHVYASLRPLTNEELALRLRGKDAGAGAEAITDLDTAFPLIDEPGAADAHAEDHAERIHRDLVAHAPIAADGTFELALEPEHGMLWLVLRGRRLYSAEALEVTVEDAREVVLTAECGALLSGRLVPPHGKAAGVQEKVELTLTTALQDTIGKGTPREFVQRKVDVAPDGLYEFRALPPAGPFTLDVDAELVACSRFDVAALHAGEERHQDFELLAGARVRGRVLDDAGLPVAEARVEAREAGRFFGFDDRDLRDAETDGDGRFELEAVLPGTVRIFAEADGYLENEGTEIELVDGQTHEGTLIEVGRGAAIAGRVSWPDGSPVEGAEIDVRFDMAQMGGMGAFNARRGADGDAETGADGRFRITGLGKGPFTVKASARLEKAEARHRARFDGVQPGDETLELVLEPPLGLTGRVVSSLDRTPVSTFDVAGHEASDGMLGALGKEQAKDEFEDDEGRFFLEGLRAGAWTMRVRAEGFAASEEIAVALPQKEGEELVVELAPEVRVLGTVVSPTGTPVAGATVRVDTGVAAWRDQIDDATGFGSPKAETRGDGSFELAGLAPGAHALFARSEDWARSETVTVDLDQGQDVDDLTLVLRAGGTLTGEVWNKDEPAAGYFVQVTRMETFDQKMTFVGADGTFEVLHIDEGTWQIVAMAMGGASRAGSDEDDDGSSALGDMMSQLKMTVADIVEDEITHVVLGAQAADPVEVRGHVTHAGAPYSGGIVTFYAEGEEVMETMRNTSVAKDGSYSVELARPGQYVIQIQKIGSMGQQRLVEFARLIPAGSPELVLDFEIPNGRVSGLVEASDGAPAAGVRVSLHPEGALESGTLWGGQYAETTTERDGRYDIEGLRPGRYSLMAGGSAFGNMLEIESRHGRVARSIQLGEGEWRRDEDFRLPEASTVTVTVIDASGKPVAEAAVFARDANGRLLDRLSMTTTDASGNAEYTGLGEGSYSLAARKDGLASVESTPVKLGEGSSAAVELRMEPGTLLVITISGDGDELLNAQISVRDQQGNEVNGMLSLANLMKMFSKGFSSKEHTVGPLPPGKYIVEATGSNGEKVKKPVTLSGQEERRLRLKFD